MVTTLNANADPGDYPPADYKIEPYKFTAREIRKLISLIRKNSCETDIDKHLRSNLSLLAFASKFFHSGHHGTWVIPQATIKPPSFSNGPGKIPDYQQLPLSPRRNGLPVKLIDWARLMIRAYATRALLELLQIGQTPAGTDPVFHHAPKAFNRIEMVATPGRQAIQAKLLVPVGKR
jgi:hypothetical protein